MPLRTPRAIFDKSIGRDDMQVFIILCVFVRIFLNILVTWTFFPMRVPGSTMSNLRPSVLITQFISFQEINYPYIVYIYNQSYSNSRVLLTSQFHKKTNFRRFWDNQSTKFDSTSIYDSQQLLSWCILAEVYLKREKINWKDYVVSCVSHVFISLSKTLNQRTQFFNTNIWRLWSL